MSSATPSPIARAGDAGRRIALALVAHTNVGKTTLARTLTGRDVGEVRDAPHVTEFSDAHVLIETAEGERLVLWDTPGFGDSVRLAQRLRREANPVARFLGELWDRWRNRPLWASQQVLRTVRDEADALLYLVNAGESPAAAAYVPAELEILAWTGKPVVVVLNQLGPARSPADEAGDVARWERALSAHRFVRAVLPLDAFARAWVQERTLFDALVTALPPEQAARMARLRDAWMARRERAFEAAMQVLATRLGRIAVASVPLPASSVGERLKTAGAALGRRLGMGADRVDPATAAAEQALRATLDHELVEGTRELISLHGLGGDAAGAILEGFARDVEWRERLDETQAAAWGGVVAGALTGLKADILSGGLTLGGGLIAGGLLGALGGAGLARAANRLRGTDTTHAAWGTSALDAITEAFVLRYLAVAHHGRGRGDWRPGALPAHWATAVHAALEARRDALTAAWARRSRSGATVAEPVQPDPRRTGTDGVAEAGADEAPGSTPVVPGGERDVADALEPVLRAAAREVLSTLHPEATVPTVASVTP